MITLEDRLETSEKDNEFLLDIYNLFSIIKHNLYKELYVKKSNPNETKTLFIKRFGITGRQYNSIYNELRASISSIQELQKFNKTNLEEKISSAKKWILTKERKVNSLSKKINIFTKKISQHKPIDSQELSKFIKDRKSLLFKIHNKKRYLYSLEQKLSKLENDISQGNASICFGSKDLFRKQHNLKDNKHLYKNHQEWLEGFRFARANQVFFLGSKDETSGNQSCTYIKETNSLRIRVPSCLESKYGKYYCLSFPKFKDKPKSNYNRHMQVVEALERATKNTSPISYRIITKKYKDSLRTYLQVVFTPDSVDIVTLPELGAIGVDLNANHVAVASLDRFGNVLPKQCKRINISIYKRSSEQIEANLSDVVVAIVKQAKESKKPIIVEKLDFTKKRNSLREQNPKYSRMLSSFAYKKFYLLLESRCKKEGVELLLVNPAYTSIIGLVKFSRGYGLSSHQSAATTIGRRGMGQRSKFCKHNEQERLSCNHNLIPKGLSERVATKAKTALLLLEDNNKHVWSEWALLAKRLKKESLDSILEPWHPGGGREGITSLPSNSEHTNTGTRVKVPMQVGLICSPGEDPF